MVYVSYKGRCIVNLNKMPHVLVWGPWLWSRLCWSLSTKSIGNWLCKWNGLWCPMQQWCGIVLLWSECLEVMWHRGTSPFSQVADETILYSLYLYICSISMPLHSAFFSSQHRVMGWIVPDPRRKKTQSPSLSTSYLHRKNGYTLLQLFKTCCLQFPALRTNNLPSTS